MEGCLKEIPDCGTKKNININGLCYETSEYPGDCDTFSSELTNYENPSYISSTSGTLLLDCLTNCHNIDECNAIHFSYNSSSKQKEDEIPGYCQLVKNSQPGKVLPVPEPGYSCALNYNRSKPLTLKNCINIASPNNSLSIDLSSSNSPIVKERILTKYLGADCRKNVANSDLDTDSNSKLLQTMGNWCQENKDIDVCKTFCNNSSYSQFCNIQPNKFPIVMTILFFVCIFFVIVSAIHIKNIKIKISIIILLTIGAIIIAYIGYKNYTDFSANQGYTGTKKDYSSGSTWQWTNSSCNVEKIYNGTYTNDSCCGSIGGGDPRTCDPKGKQNCPVWDQMNEATAIQPKEQKQTNVILGLTLYSDDGNNGIAGYSDLVYIDALDKKATPSTNDLFYGKCSEVQPLCRDLACKITIGINATDKKYKIPPGYALQSIQPYFYTCKMSTIQFNFAHLWDVNQPIISIVWLGEPDCIFDKQINCKGTPPGCCDNMPLIEGSVCQKYTPGTPSKNVRWFVNNWNILWSDHHHSGKHSGFYYFGLHRFASVDFVGFEPSGDI